MDLVARLRRSASQPAVVQARGSGWAARQIAVYEKYVDSSFVPFCDLASRLVGAGLSGWSSWPFRLVGGFSRLSKICYCDRI